MKYNEDLDWQEEAISLVSLRSVNNSENREQKLVTYTKAGFRFDGSLLLPICSAHSMSELVS